MLFTLPYYFHRTFNNYTGGQSVSFVLLWQPSDCIDLFVIDYIVLFTENKYDDDDALTLLEGNAACKTPATSTAKVYF